VRAMPPRLSGVRMSGEQARARFAGARVARLATVDAAGHPQLVPVVFALLGPEIVTAIDGKPKSGRPLSRLTNIAGNPAVSLLVDEYDEDWTRLWWARADGTARLVATPTSAVSAALAALRTRYAQYERTPLAGPVIAVAVRRWSGWSAAGP
jgi:PPOX class probable F420-dependent enzyme